MKIKIGVRFEPRDLWIGVYWNRFECAGGKYLDVYICLIPMFPICLHYAEMKQWMEEE